MGAKLGWGLQVQSIAREGKVNLKNQEGGTRAKSVSRLVPNRDANAILGAVRGGGREGDQVPPNLRNNRGLQVT
jgi:hypothetical protein